MGPMELLPGERVWIRDLKISNFRSIASLELKFRYRLTLLIGDNGAGKTTVLDAIAACLGTKLQLDSTDMHVIGGKPADLVRLELSDHDGDTGWVEIKRSDPASQNPRHRRGARLADLVKVQTDVTSQRPPRWVVNAHYGAERTYGAEFKDLVDWFTEKDIEEARQVRAGGDLGYRQPQLEIVRRAVTAMIPGSTNLRVDAETARLSVDQKVGPGTETFQLEQLAAGFRTMLALVADLARRIEVAKETRVSNFPIVVLIDEIDLHLHPRWQLDVVQNLLAAFPDVQFIVTTHSEEIIASVPSECVVSLKNVDHSVVAKSIPAVQGATFDRVLTDVMGVPDRRPPEAESLLREYWKYVDDGLGESDQARDLRARLDKLFRGDEPELVRADLAIRRVRAVRGVRP